MVFVLLISSLVHTPTKTGRFLRSARNILKVSFLNYISPIEDLCCTFKVDPANASISSLLTFMFI